MNWVHFDGGDREVASHEKRAKFRRRIFLMQPGEYTVKGVAKTILQE